MTTVDIIKSKVEDQINDCGMGFSDVFNGKRVSTYTHFHLNIITVSIKGYPCAEFNRFDQKGISEYIINKTNY